MKRFFSLLLCLALLAALALPAAAKAPELSAWYMDADGALKPLGKWLYALEWAGADRQFRLPRDLTPADVGECYRPEGLIDSDFFCWDFYPVYRDAAGRVYINSVDYTQDWDDEGSSFVGDSIDYAENRSVLIPVADLLEQAETDGQTLYGVCLVAYWTDDPMVSVYLGDYDADGDYDDEWWADLEKDTTCGVYGFTLPTAALAKLPEVLHPDASELFLYAVGAWDYDDLGYPPQLDTVAFLGSYALGTTLYYRGGSISAFPEEDAPGAVPVTVDWPKFLLTTAALPAAYHIDADVDGAAKTLTVYGRDSWLIAPECAAPAGRSFTEWNVYKVEGDTAVFARTALPRDRIAVDAYQIAGDTVTGLRLAAVLGDVPVDPPYVSPYLPPYDPGLAPAQTETRTPGPAGFSDVHAGDWFYDAVLWASAQGLMVGYGNGYFGPDDAVTGADFTQVLRNLAGGLAPAGIDAPADGAKLSREACVAALYRYAESAGLDVSARGDLSAFADADSVSADALEAMQWAVGIGLVKGMGNATLAPRAGVTRAQLAAMLQRFPAI
ncbi:MAG: S-layer homology domain-containing protein [Ruminococcaceae bacterium]|nr:S-layer homology domain-containing protein [Oscillospiraceae bacterium]